MDNTTTRSVIFSGIFVILAAVIAGIFGLWEGIFTNQRETLTQVDVVFEPVQATLTAISNTLVAPTQMIQATETQFVIETRVAVELATAITWTPMPTPAIDIPLSMAWDFIYLDNALNSDWIPYLYTFEDGHEMALVPTGCFKMGVAFGDNDQSVRLQCVEEPFWIDVTEITNAEYGSIGCERTSSEINQPRNCITWFGADDYCQVRGGSLPTELQWEFAARGVESWNYPWQGRWFAAYTNSMLSELNETQSVGFYVDGSSWVGALDMAGNVWEWTSSFYGGNTNEFSPRVLRGGSFLGSSDDLRTFNRMESFSVNSLIDVGFRCVLPIDAVP